MAKAKKKNSGILTLRMLLGHMQAGFESVKTELRAEFRGECGAIRRELEPLKQAAAESKRSHERTHLALQRLYDRRIETVAKVDDHEERITVIEDVELPKVKAAVGIA